MNISEEPRHAPIEQVSARDVVALAESVAGLCVSIYIPTQRKGIEVSQSAIHLKNLLAEVESELTKRGFRWDEIEALTSGARALIGQEGFWRHQGDGLSLFLSSEYSRMFELPMAVAPRQTVSTTFDIVPLLPILSGDGRYYILTVSANDVRLFDATRFGYTQVEVEGAPSGMEEALWADDNERQQQWHSGAAASPKGGGRSAMYFGTGDEGGMEKHKVNFKRYFNKVDAALASTFKQRPAPVVLAGVQYLLPIYRKANTCAKLLEGEVHGNQDRSTEEEIHHDSWAIAGPYFQESLDDAVARFHELLGSGLASADEDEISEAAAFGRIQTLFVCNGIEGANQSSINATAIETLLKKGEIITLAHGAMPTETSTAATFRY